MSLLGNRKVGVDIGATAVRVAEVVGVDADGYAVVRRAAIVPIKEGSIVAGEVKNPVVLGQALSFALKQAGVPRQGFVLGSSSRYVTVGRLESPGAVAPHERTAQIRLSRKEISPTVPIEDSAVSWNTIPGYPVQPGNTALNVALMKRLAVEEMQKVCKIASAMPQAIDMNAAGVVRAMVRCFPDDHAVASVVDVGASKISVVTRQGLHVRSVRIVAQGGQNITRALMGAEDVDYEEAEHRKRYIRLNRARSAPAGGYADVVADDSLAPTIGEQAVQAAVDQLIEEIAKSVAADSQASNGSASQAVQLTGGAARIPGFADRLQLRLGIPVVLAKPWADLQFNKNTAPLFRDGEPDPEALGDLTAAIGLALWKVPS